MDSREILNKKYVRTQESVCGTRQLSLARADDRNPVLCDVQHVRSDAEPIRWRNILRLLALRLLKLLQRLHCQHYVCRDF